MMWCLHRHAKIINSEEDLGCAFKKRLDFSEARGVQGGLGAGLKNATSRVTITSADSTLKIGGNARQTLT